MTYPYVRMRRLRQANWVRELISESQIKPSDLILPLFVIDGEGQPQEVPTMPGVYRYPIGHVVDVVKQAADFGISMVALFPLTEATRKDETGTYALDQNNVVCRAIRSIKGAVNNIGIMADVALDPYTTHGHDGVLGANTVDNDTTIEILVKQALTLAQAGVDAVSPSDMMDGRIGVIRECLEHEGFHETLIISYAAKYASAFYGPFRDAVKSARPNGEYLDKRSYQMDPRNALEAVREAILDVQEGADMLIVKPGLPFLDIISTVSNAVDVPVLGYQVSGEYAMLKYAALAGALDYTKAMLESLIGFKRAGASGILTYAALDVASWCS